MGATALVDLTAQVVVTAPVDLTAQVVLTAPVVRTALGPMGVLQQEVMVGA